MGKGSRRRPRSSSRFHVRARASAESELERRIEEEAQGHPVVTVVLCEVCESRIHVGVDRLFFVGSSAWPSEKRVCFECASDLFSVLGWPDDWSDSA